MSAHSESAPVPPRANARGREGGRLDVSGLLLNGLHLTVLTAFGLAQPLFDVLKKEPEFFASRGSHSVDIIVFAIVVTVGLPIVLVVVELLVSLVSRCRP